jgi:hypothetical protein
MVAACGAESRIAKKYAAFVEETRQHGKLLSPLVGGQLGFIVSLLDSKADPPLLTEIVLWAIFRVRLVLLVWRKVLF